MQNSSVAQATNMHYFAFTLLIDAVLGKLALSKQDVEIIARIKRTYFKPKSNAFQCTRITLSNMMTRPAMPSNIRRSFSNMVTRPIVGKMREGHKYYCAQA